MPSHDPLQNTIGNIGIYQCFIGLIVWLPLLMKGIMDSVQDSFHEAFYRCEGSSEDNTCPCSKPIFYNRTIKSSPIIEWELVCEKREYFLYVMETFANCVPVVAFLIGILADRFGRKFMLIITILMLIFTWFGTASISLLWSYIILKFLLDGLLTAIPFIALSLQLELTGYDQRFMFIVFYSLSTLFGFLVIPMIGIYPTDFRKFLLFLAMPTPLAITFFVHLLESPRWLILNNKPTEAVVVLQRIAAINGRTRAGILIKVFDYRVKLDTFKLKDITFINMIKCIMNKRMMMLITFSSLSFYSALIQSLSIMSDFGEDIREENGTNLLSERIVLTRFIGILLSTVLAVPFTTFSMRSNVIFFLSSSAILTFIASVSHGKEKHSISTATKFLSICSLCCLNYYTEFFLVDLTPTMVRTTVFSFSNLGIFIFTKVYSNYIFPNAIVQSVDEYVGIALAILVAILFSRFPYVKHTALISTLNEEIRYENI